MDLHFDQVVVFLVKWYKLYLTEEELENLKSLNNMYREIINDVLHLRCVDFLALKLLWLDYAEQTEISNQRIDLATVCSIYYGLNTGMVICYLKGE
jgi:hypothetical protein